MRPWGIHSALRCKSRVQVRRQTKGNKSPLSHGSFCGGVRFPGQGPPECSESRPDRAGGSRGPLTPSSFLLLVDLLFLAGLASSVFILSELLKLCERYCSCARKAQGPPEQP